MRTTPFGWVDQRAQPIALAVLTGLLVGTSIWLAAMGRALVTQDAPNGIVSYELAGSLVASDAIIRSWSPGASSIAMLSLGFDYLYLFVYPAWLSLAVVRSSASLGGAWARAGAATSWLVLAAAPLDAVENYSLVQQLIHGASELHAQVAWWCAVPKFALVALAAAFLVMAGSARLLRLRSG